MLRDHVVRGSGRLLGIRKSNPRLNQNNGCSHTSSSPYSHFGGHYVVVFGVLDEVKLSSRQGN